MTAPYQHAECDTCGEEWIGKTALMIGKKHAMDHGHYVFWEQEFTGSWDFTDSSGGER